MLIKNGRVIDPAHKVDLIADVLIEGNVIAQVGNISGAHRPDEPVIDAKGCLIAPGFVDMHAHLREPGQEAKEDFVRGTRAAAKGGFTTVATMPNTSPVVDNAALVRSLQRRAEEAAVVHVQIIGALTKGQQGAEIAEIGDMAQAGAVAFSDDGHWVRDSRLFLNALDYARGFDKIVISHAEETSLVEGGAMNEGCRSALLGVKGRPSVAEDIAVARDIMLAEYSGARLHIAHVSTKGAVGLIRQAKARGVRVTAEATPHHLTLTENDVDYTNSATKVNPPLRTQEDCDALLAGLLDGTIDSIATDHAPHAPEEKDVEFVLAPSGFPGLETALGVLLTDLVRPGKLDVATLMAKMSYAPAHIFGLYGGSLDIGDVADLVIIDPARRWTVADKRSPWCGRELQGQVVTTMIGGDVVWTAN